MIIHDPSSIPGNGGFEFASSYNPVPWTNGPVGETNYVDDCWGVGINMSAAGSSRIDTSKPSIGVTWESKFYNSGTFACEWHVQGIMMDGTNHRPLSIFLPQDGTTRTSGVSVSADQFNVNNALGSNVLSVNDPNYTGGFPAILQLNTPSGFASNSKLLNLVGPSLTGLVEYLRVTATITSSLYSKIINQGTGSVWQSLEVAAGGGDAYVQFQVGSTAWTVGGDNSDSDAFTIANGAPGTNNKLRIDADVAAFGVPAKLPGYTVAGVPSASTAGAGAMIYVTNESGGAVPAFSDGTNWRRVTDRAIIS